MRSVPFSRFNLTMAAVAALLSSVNGYAMDRLAALQQVGGYESRGKGRGRSQASSRRVAHDKRAAKKRRNVAKNKSHH